MLPKNTYLQRNIIYHPIIIIHNTIKSSETIDTFRKKLKTYLFEIAFLPYIFGDSMRQCQLFPVPVYD